MSEAKPMWTTRSPTTATEAAHLRRMLEELDDELAELAERQEGARRLLRIALGRLRG